MQDHYALSTILKKKELKWQDRHLKIKKTSQEALDTVDKHLLQPKEWIIQFEFWNWATHLAYFA